MSPGESDAQGRVGSSVESGRHSGPGRDMAGAGVLLDSGSIGEPLTGPVLRRSSSFQCRCRGSLLLRTPVELTS